MTGYMIIPLGLTDEQEHIYIKMYKMCDFNTMTVKYTVDQLVTDSNKKLDLTVKKVRNILKFLNDNHYIEVVKKGSKGNPTVYKIIKIQELNELNGQLKDNQRAIKGQLKDNQNGSTMPIIEDEGQLKGKQKANKGQLKGNPIKEKEKEKEKDIFYEEQKQNSFVPANKFYMDLTFIEDHISTVRITEKEYNKLLEKYSKKLVHDKIELLDAYADNDKYDNHFKVLSIWCKKDKDKEDYKEQLNDEKPKADTYTEIKEGYEQEDKYAMYKPKEPPVWVKDWT